MRKLTMLLTPLLVLALVLTVVGCGGDDEETPTPAMTGSETPEPTSTGMGYTGGKYTFKISHQASPGSSSDNLITYMGERLEYYTDGQVKLEVFPMGTLFGFYEEFDAVTTGAIDMVSMSDMQPVLAGLWDFMVGYLAFFWGETWEESGDHDARFQAHPEGGGKLATQLEERGIKLLGVMERGGITVNITGKKELKSQYDQKGMKIRSIGGMADLMIDAVGAISVGLDTSEMITAFEQGVIDILATDPDRIYNAKLYEQAKYGLCSSAVAAHVFIVMNLNYWNKLPAELQDIWMNKVIPDCTAWSEENAVSDALATLDLLEEEGMILHWMPNDERVELCGIMFEEAVKQKYLVLVDQDMIKLADHLRSEPYDTGTYVP